MIRRFLLTAAVVGALTPAVVAAQSATSGPAGPGSGNQVPPANSASNAGPAAPAGRTQAAANCLKAAQAAEQTITMQMSGYGDYAKRESARAHLGAAEEAAREGDAQRCQALINWAANDWR